MENEFTKTERNLAAINNALELCLKLIKEMNEDFERQVDAL